MIFWAPNYWGANIFGPKFRVGHNFLGASYKTGQCCICTVDDTGYLDNECKLFAGLKPQHNLLFVPFIWYMEKIKH